MKPTTAEQALRDQLAAREGTELQHFSASKLDDLTYLRDQAQALAGAVLREVDSSAKSVGASREVHTAAHGDPIQTLDPCRLYVAGAY